MGLFSLAKIGAVSVPINNSFKSKEIKHYVDFSKPELFITGKKTSSKLNGILDKSKIVEFDILKFNSDSYENINQKNTNIHDNAIYLFSTGSTGKPKCVARSHKNMIALADNHTSSIDWDVRDRILFVIPISHTYGLGNFISSIRAGCTCYLMEEFNRRKTMRCLTKNKITIFPAVPFMLDILSRSRVSNDDDFSKLRYVISAGAPLNMNTFYSFYNTFHVYPRQLYGSSETGVMAINLHEDIEKYKMSVGRPVKNVEIKILDDSNEELGKNTLGEIVVKSPSMTDEYVDSPVESEKSFRNGFYHTGDLGMIDEDGYIFIKGRKKLFINISGNKVDPYEVEDVIESHQNVREAVVVGVINEMGNEVVMVVIVGENISRKEIVDYCKDKISDYKIPKIIEFRSSLPKSPTGKVLRDKIRRNG